MDEDGGDSAEEDNDERRRERWRWRRRRKGESEFDFEAKVNFETILKFPLNCNYVFDHRWRFGLFSLLFFIRGSLIWSIFVNLLGNFTLSSIWVACEANHFRRVILEGSLSDIRIH